MKGFIILSIIIVVSATILAALDAKTGGPKGLLYYSSLVLFFASFITIIAGNLVKK